jgi:hypothetical protein
METATMKQLLCMISLPLLLTTTLVFAADHDDGRKSGEWEISVTVTGQSTQTNKYCIDSASDDIAATAGGGVAQSDCEETHTGRSAQGVTIRSVCKQGNSTVTTTGTLSGDLETGYQGEITKNYSPPLYGRTEIKSTVEGRFLGSCP